MYRKYFLSSFLILIYFFNINHSYSDQKTLRVGLSGLPPSLGNPYSSMGLPSGHFWRAMYDALTTISITGEVLPALAERWSQINNKTWLFTLRKDIFFHNNKSFNAYSVENIFTYLISKEAQHFYISNEIKNIKNVKAISEYKVEITTHDPDLILPRRLSLIMIPEYSQWNELGPSEYSKRPIGTGPFHLIKWSKGNNSAILKAFNNPMRSSKSINRLDIKSIPNALSREQALLANDIDLAENINHDSIKHIESMNHQIQLHNRSVILSIALPNTLDNKSPLTLYKVREALNYAVDKESISKHIFDGLVKPASQGALEGTVGYNASLKPFPYNPTKAKEMLIDAGYKDGFNLNIAILQTRGSAQEIAFQKVQQDLNSVGIRTIIKPLAPQDFINRFLTNNWEEFNAFSLLWNNEPMRDVSRSIEYFSCLRPNPFFCDEEITKLIKNSRLKSDHRSRINDLKAIMRELNNVLPSILLTSQPLITATNKKITYIKMEPSGLNFEDIIME